MSWDQRLRLALLVVLAAVLQTALFGDARVLGVAPDVGLVLTIAVAYRAGAVTGVIFGFASGLAGDTFLQTPFGVSALSYAVIGYVVGVLETGIARPPRWIAPLLGGVAGLAGTTLFVAVAVAAGQDHLLALRTLRILALAAVYDAVLAIVVFPIARWAARDRRPPVSAPSGS